MKNTEKTGNVWSRQLRSFVKGTNQGRNELKFVVGSGFTKEQMERYAARYDEIIAGGIEQNKNTKERIHILLSELLQRTNLQYCNRS